ncbi:hypothetical protein V5799_010313 [Amblyomma americanum]|uniref:BPTI/Kunitz inhibitor domain-containing protein n=1 Tax=Amblyomma americanum TaxID=6943 RepID=A0AAQ4F9H0_AMBAM
MHQAVNVCVCNAPRAIPSCGGPVFDVFHYNPNTKKCHHERSCTYRGNSFPTRGECEKTCQRRRPKVVHTLGLFILAATLSSVLRHPKRHAHTQWIVATFCKWENAIYCATYLLNLISFRLK